MKNKILALAGATVMIAGVVSFSSADAQPRSARAKLVTGGGLEIGTVTFHNKSGHTEVKVRLTGAPGANAFHGFHIHANDSDKDGTGCVAEGADEGTWFLSADGHFKRGTELHSHHAGDLPVVYVNDDGSVETRFRIDTIDSGELVGKAVILHDKPDNYANIPLTGTNSYTDPGGAKEFSNKTGNSGNRLACGVIEAR